VGLHCLFTLCYYGFLYVIIRNNDGNIYMFRYVFICNYGETQEKGPEKNTIICYDTSFPYRVDARKLWFDRRKQAISFDVGSY